MRDFICIAAELMAAAIQTFSVPHTAASLCIY